MNQMSTTQLSRQIPSLSPAAPASPLAAPAAVSPQRLQRGIARGRRLQGEAVRTAFRTVFDLVFTQRPQRGASLTARRQFS